MTLRRIARRLASLLRKRRLDRDLDSEIQAHLELAERDAQARGLSPAEARREALLLFGGVEQIRESHRESRTFLWLDNFLRDLRFGAGALGRSPAFSALVIGVLALGIGANVAMFSVVNAVLLEPLPFTAPDRIVGVWDAPRPGIVNAATAPDFLEWRRLGSDVFEALSAEQGLSAVLTGTGEPTRWPGKAVTADYFRVFAVPVHLGRTFSPDDETPGAAPVIVISHAAWQTHFSADPAILGRRPVLDGQPHEIIGVLAPGPFDRDEARFWKPLAFTPEQRSARVHWLTLFGRIRPGVALQQARQRMQSVHAALTEGASAEERAASIEVQPLDRLLIGPGLERTIAIAFAAVALVLLIACANVANLLLAQGAARHRELGIRAALGAGRLRLVSQLLTECLVLCAAGGIGGVLTARILLQLSKPFLADYLPFTANLALDLRVLAFAAGVVLLVALLAGIIPALHTSFGNLADTLNRATRGASGMHSRARRLIVIAEVALSLILIAGSLLLFRSLLKLESLDTGVELDNVTTLSLSLPPGTYRSPQQASLFYSALAGRLRQTPMVQQAGLSTVLPLQWILNGEAMQVPGVDHFLRTRFKRVDPGYFRTLGIPIIAGRGITDRDIEGSPLVMVINETMAARLAQAAGWKNAVGATARVSCPGYLAPRVYLPEIQIVGVIRNERVDSPGSPDPPVVYVPLAQVPSPDIKLLVRSSAEFAALVPALRDAIHQVDPHLPAGDIATLEQVHRRTLSGASRPAWGIGVFAAIAMLLAAIGLYGVISHSVAQQRREIGIRMALGAAAGNVVRQILRSAAVLVAIGLLLGLAGTFALTRLMRGLLYETSPLDPLALATACGTMLVIGLAAGLLPARRAAHIDPATTIREES